MTTKRVVYLDILNVTAIFAVLFLHSNGIVHEFTPTPQWAQSLVFEVLCYWAVPIFFMNSGITLLAYRERYSTKDFFQKRLRGAVIPFLFWSLLLLGYKISAGRIPVQDLNPTRILSMILNTELERTYWFFIPLFSIYLAMPLFSLVESNHRIMRYTIFTAFLTMSFFPALSRLFSVQYNYSLMMPAAAGCLIFPLLGRELFQLKTTRKQRCLVYLLAIAACIWRYAFAYFDSYAAGKTIFRFPGYDAPHSLILAVAVFLFVQNTSWDKLLPERFLHRILPKLADATLGVYLLHMPVFRHLRAMLGLSMASLRVRLLFPFAVYAICLILTLVIKKIPYLRRTLP